MVKAPKYSGPIASFCTQADWMFHGAGDIFAVSCASVATRLLGTNLAHGLSFAIMASMSARGTLLQLEGDDLRVAARLSRYAHRWSRSESPA